MVSRDGWYQRTTLLPADHHATGSTRGMDLPMQEGDTTVGASCARPLVVAIHLVAHFHTRGRHLFLFAIAALRHRAAISIGDGARHFGRQRDRRHEKQHREYHRQGLQSFRTICVSSSAHSGSVTSTALDFTREEGEMVHKCMVTSIVRELHPWVEEQTPGPSGPAPTDLRSHISVPVWPKVADAVIKA